MGWVQRILIEKIEKMLKLLARSYVRIPVIALAISALFLPSCGGSSGTLGSVGFDDSENRIIGEATVAGTLLGALGGAVIAHNTGGKAEKGAMWGALAGGLLGNQVGRGQANTARQWRNVNDQYRNAIAMAQQNNARLEAYNRKVAAKLAELRRRPAAQRAALAQAEIAGIDQQLKAAQTYTSQRQVRKNKYANVGSKMSSSYASEISRGQRAEAQLASYRNEYAKMSMASN